MAGINEDRDRQVVPRWRTFEGTLHHREIQPLRFRVESPFRPEMVATLRQEWTESQSPTIASDFVSVCLALGLWDQARDAAEFVLKRLDTTDIAKQISTRYLQGDMEAGHEDLLSFDSPWLRSQVALTRQKLIAYPRNAMLWANASYLYTTLGVDHKATNCMRLALALAPHDRFVLRAATRLFLHQGDFRASHRLMEESPLVSTDPWILSAEIAIAAAMNKTSKRIKAAKRMLDGERFLPFHLSELAMALGTLEFKNGNRKGGRRLLAQSLIDPSENSLAQAGWLARKSGPPIGPIPALNPSGTGSRSHEANTWLYYTGEQWELAMTESQLWLSDQPFSSRPAVMGSFIATSILGDHVLSVRIASIGLRSNPTDFTLRNNLAFALANDGSLEEAKRQILIAGSLSMSASERAVCNATRGFIEFRSGNAERGRMLYTSAIAEGTRLGFENIAAAKAHYALEEIRIGSPCAQAAKDNALSALAKCLNPAIKWLENKLGNK